MDFVAVCWLVSSASWLKSIGSKWSSYHLKLFASCISLGAEWINWTCVVLTEMAEWNGNLFSLWTWFFFFPLYQPRPYPNYAHCPTVDPYASVMEIVLSWMSYLHYDFDVHCSNAHNWLWHGWHSCWMMVEQRVSARQKFVPWISDIEMFIWWGDT